MDLCLNMAWQNLGNCGGNFSFRCLQEATFTLCRNCISFKLHSPGSFGLVPKKDILYGVSILWFRSILTLLLPTVWEHLIVTYCHHWLLNCHAFMTKVWPPWHRSLQKAWCAEIQLHLLLPGALIHQLTPMPKTSFLGRAFKSMQTLYKLQISGQSSPPYQKNCSCSFNIDYSLLSLLE